MTDRERQMIEFYLPHEPDPTLERDEYYFNYNNRIIRVQIFDIMPHDEEIEYGIYQNRGGRYVRIDTHGNINRGVHMYELYDNKEDCRAGTHMAYDGWEHLRLLQREEAKNAQ